MNMLTGRIIDADHTGVRVAFLGNIEISVAATSGSVKVDDRVTLGIRPEGLRPDSTGPLFGTTHLIERLGSISLIHVGPRPWRSSGCTGWRHRRCSISPADRLEHRPRPLPCIRRHGPCIHTHDSAAGLRRSMIVVCGEALIDLFMEFGQSSGPSLQPVIGGSQLNLAIGLTRLGAPAAFLGGLSIDYFGHVGRHLAEGRNRYISDET
jgi:hypothetical protein